MEEILAVIEKLKKFKPGRPLKNYITHARFPRFKNIEPGMSINFEFPFTVLVGANGSGKTSLLHALYGMPYGYTTSRFWFSTNLDPISDKPLQRYVYGHWHEEYNNVVETRKARIGNQRDYWEPYRSSRSDGMKPVPSGDYEGKVKDRWNPVKRKTKYINSRAIFGSFDRYMYFEHDLTANEKRETMLRAAKRLSLIKEGMKQSYKMGRRERIFKNRMLSSEELKKVSIILGRAYESAQVVQHSLYPGNRGRDFSVIFKKGSEYSEAFAGSGEVAAVYIVMEILAAEDYSLILLDEPETSLHPGAQRELFHFLLEQILLKKHQIVVSTHSAEFLSGLPQEAIKVFEDNGNGQSRILPKSSPSAALNRLGYLPQNKWLILVEDVVAKELIIQAAAGLDKGDRESLEVEVAPGGAEHILKYLGPAQMITGNKVLVLLDGDKKKVNEFTDPAKIPKSEYENLESLIMREIGPAPQYFISGGTEQFKKAAKIEASLKYLAWLRNHLDYFHKKIPEIIILDFIDPSVDHSQMNSSNAKEALKSLLTRGVNRILTADQINTLTIVEVSKIPETNPDLTIIRNRLKLWLHGNS